jgi:amino acid adenylation domain-containing protein
LLNLTLFSYRQIYSLKMHPLSGRSTGHSSSGSVHELVALQAASNPDATALAHASYTISYKELNERAEVLAKALRGLGVGPEVVVGVCLQRSPAMVIGALAILKAGGAYLPLDPINPSGRLEFMAKDAQISVLVSGLGNEKKLSGGAWPTIVLDEGGRMMDAPVYPRPIGALAETTPKTLAYVIYTSGSTGDPNGVEVAHENLVNLVHWHQQAFEVTSGNRVSHIASVGFDAAVWEIWPCLAAGGSVHIPSEQVMRNPESLRNWLVAEGITISFVPTPMAELLLSLKWPAQTALRTMLTGADTLRRYPPAGLPFQLVNNYGPTECTVVATSGRVFPEDTQNVLPPIGRPIANTQVYILDESGQPLPAGTEGELYIGGAGVVRGYRNRPDLTAKRFVSDPFAAKPGGRMFKTGDIARLLPDGQAVFVRRMDDQVKVRGFRIEPNEIAAVLNHHPRVMQSVVVARETAEGGRHLVGYVVPALEDSPTPGELRDFLRVRLPDYMIPDIFVKLENLPLSTNGKINRSELAAPNEVNTLRDTEFTAPRNDLEKKVAGILGSLLGVEGVDVEANFFDLGGHSLVGAQLIARIRSVFGVEMKLRALFEGPTVAKVSEEIQRLVLKREGEKDNEVQGMLETDAHAGVGR